MWFVSTLFWLAAPAVARADILVVAPHPDDDIITSSGVVQRALQRGEQVRVVFVTNGDFVSVSMGTVRQGEAVLAQGHLGNPENRLSFLGYPDGGLATIRSTYTAPGSSFITPHGISTTYASRGLGSADYHTYRFGSPGLYNWPTMVGDLADIINTSRPTHIFTPSQWDTHSDHSTTYHLVRAAALQVIGTAPGYNPTIHKTSVWPGDGAWPLPSDGSTYFTPFNHLGISDPAELIWSERESLDVPSSMQVTFSPTNAKYLAISAHDSQGGMNRYIGQWVHKDEFFWTEQLTGSNRPPVPNAGLDHTVDEGVLVTLDGSASWDRNAGVVTHQWRQVAGPAVTLSSLAVAQPTFTAPTGLAADAVLEFELIVSDGALSSVPDGVRVIVRSSAPAPTWGPNVAPLATVSASTERTATGQTAAKAVDGFIDGYPGDATREWVTAGEGVGAWYQMNWSTPVTIGRVVLYDRPNSADQILGGEIAFSDGSTLPIGLLVNTGGATEYTFPARSVTSLRLTVTQVSSGTANAGLAEFQVFESASAGGAPQANAGPDQAATVGQVVALNGAGSSDPNGDPLQYAWSQTSGSAVTLSSSSAMAPTFTVPAAAAGTVLTFALTVSDGALASSPDSVSISVAALPPPPPPAGNVAPIATVTASSERAPTQAAAKAVDTVVDGYPGDASREWATDGQAAGAWIQLNWSAGQRVSRIVLHDRPNTDDHIQAGTLTFSDGSSIPVGALNNNGTATELAFAPRVISWVRLTVTTASPQTANVGLAEFLVVLEPEAPSEPPTLANIAPSATVTASAQNAPLQAASKAVDRIISGYPVLTSAEWVAPRRGAGTWIQLDWPATRVVNVIRLYDRVNGNDHITGGTLLFSDGTSIRFAALPNTGGSGLEVAFAAKRVRSVRMRIDSVASTTRSIGLAEIEVFGR